MGSTRGWVSFFLVERIMEDLLCGVGEDLFLMGFAKVLGLGLLRKQRLYTYLLCR